MLSDLNLPPFEDRRRNIRLAYFYKVVEGVVPAIPPQKYLTSRKPGRNIRAKNFSNFAAGERARIESVARFEG
jgi:hypothetical protein